MSFLLKIVEGPNRGAEIALVEGVDVTFGKGEDCDVVLADPTLPDEAIVFNASADGVTVGGERLEPYYVKTLGATSFAVGPVDSPWQELVWPTHKAPERSDEEGESAEAAAGAPAEAAKEKGDAAAKEKPAEEKKEKKGGRSALVCIVAVILFLLLLLLICWFMRGKIRSYVGAGEPGSAHATTEASKPTLEDIAERYGLKLDESGDAPAFSGNFKTRAERLRATAEIYSMRPGAALDFSDDESFRSAAEDGLFTLSEGALKVVSATNRALKVSGKVSSPAELARILKALSADLPRLEKVDAADVAYSSRVRVKLDDDDDDSGETSSESSAAIERASADSDDDASFADEQLIAESALELPPALPVCGILTMPYRCLVMRDGRRIMEGGTVGEFAIVEIGADAVVLTNSTRRIVWKP